MDSQVEVSPEMLQNVGKHLRDVVDLWSHVGVGAASQLQGDTGTRSKQSARQRHLQEKAYRAGSIR